MNQFARLTALSSALAGALLLFAMGSAASAAGTAAGTTITNTATASYGDGTNTYNTTSNTVTSTVQNAPSLTITGSVAKVVTPGTAVTDTFTVTNTGNAPAYFQFDSNTGTSSTANATSLTYTIVGATGGSGLTYAQLNNYFLHSDPNASSGSPYTAAAGSSVSITVNYTVSNSAPDATALTQTLEGGSYQPAVGAAPAANTGTSNNAATANVVDTVHTDAVLVATKTAVVGGTTAAPLVTYTIGGYNSGKQNSVPVALPLLQALNNGTNPAFTAGAGAGYLITDKLPTTVGGTHLTLNTGYTIVTTQPGSCTSAVVYSASATSGWTTLNTGTVNYVGLYVYGSSCVLSSSGSSDQISMTFELNGSTATGDGNATAVKNIANGIIGTQAGTLYGPFTDGATPANTSGDTTALTASDTPIGQSTISGHGEADVTSAASPASYGVYLGPYISTDSTYKGAASAGSYNGVAAVNTSDDFTAAVLPTVTSGPMSSALTATGYTPASPGPEAFSGATISMPGSATVVYVAQSVYNNSNAADSYTITGTLNGTWPSGTTITFNSTPTTSGAQASGSFTVSNVTAGTPSQFYAIYTVPAAATVTAFNQYDSTVTATSTHSAGTNNPTHDDLYAGGFVALGKYATYTSDSCQTAAVSTASPVPGGCILYNLVYKNVAPSTGGTGASGNVSLTAQGVTLSDDGRSDATYGWYAGSSLTTVPTIGIATAPGDVVPTPTSPSTVTYYTWNFGGSAYGSATTSFSAPAPVAGLASDGSTSSGPAKVTVLVGGSSTYAVPPQARGVFSFKAQVRGF